jgi:Flp pilus assembly protein protease CpaA
MIFNIVIAIIFLAAAAYHDLKKKTVPTYILYPFIVIGLFMMLLTIPTISDPFFRYLSLLVASFTAVIGILANKKKLLGGADIFLFVGVILLTPIELMSIIFFINFFFFTCLTGVLYYIIMKLVGKKDAQNIKFVPCILVGYIIAVYGFLGMALL